MLIDTKTGIIKIDKDLIIDGNYTFEDFRKTKYYSDQDGIKIIFIKGEKVIANHKFLISLSFEKDLIDFVGLRCVDKKISFEYEAKGERIKIHNTILREEGILKDDIRYATYYDWGKILSNYDPRSCSSDILIVYNNGVKDF